jgi:hypothetical protein
MCSPLKVLKNDFFAIFNKGVPKAVFTYVIVDCIFKGQALIELDPFNRGIGLLKFFERAL